ncbi:hypothetical protein ACWEVY_26340 [Streptomyces longwoodensis]
MRAARCAGRRPPRRRRRPGRPPSYYFRTRSALVGACHLRLAEGTVADVDRWEAQYGSPDPDSGSEALAALLHHWLTADLLVAWTDGLLYDRLAGATAATRPAPDVSGLTSVVRRMLSAALSA